jgi:hypothetical protein
MGKRKKSHYAVARGHTRGVFTDWPTAQKAISGFPKAKFQVCSITLDFVNHTCLCLCYHSFTHSFFLPSFLPFLFLSSLSGLLLQRFCVNTAQHLPSPPNLRLAVTNRT